MESSDKLILVPYDYTQMAMYALEHATTLAKKQNAKVSILHIIKKDTDIQDAELKLKQEVIKIQSELGIEPEPIVKEGTIFKTINQVAEELNATLVIMGTHGIKGMQKLTGSWALKVIVGSQVPFLVVQDSPSNNEVKKIVFPVDFKSENKEKLVWVEFLSTLFSIKIHLFSSAAKDGSIEARTKANLVFCKNFLADRGVEFELAISEGKGSFPQETIQYCGKIKADMVLIMTTRDIAFHDYVLGAAEQQIIANSSKFPVLVINPRTDLMRYGYGGF